MQGQWSACSFLGIVSYTVILRFQRQRTSRLACKINLGLVIAEEKAEASEDRPLASYPMAPSLPYPSAQALHESGLRSWAPMKFDKSL